MKNEINLNPDGFRLIEQYWGLATKIKIKMLLTAQPTFSNLRRSEP